ncbi:MAG: 2-oxoacid:acceptor oxidoreductase family protein [Candidatus Latescibacterota bacterium]|nr:MAG: 2-oxoacid:acceptor oxidoreductase family protein [Candidatus Latescibacterota bacterium]
MDTPFRTINLKGEEVLTNRTVPVGQFFKSYLGERGRQIAVGMVEDGQWPLGVGWEEARFAAITQNQNNEVIGLVAEYRDGTVAMLAQSNGNTTDTQTIALYLETESRTPFIKGLRGWEEVAPGAVIREKSTSTDTHTGTWAKSVAVIDPEKCNSCHQCGLWCPEDGIKVDPVSGKLSFVDYDYCKGCGICHFVCPDDAQAIEMVDVSLVKAAQPKVFDGVFGKRIEVGGDLVRQEVRDIDKLTGKDDTQIIHNDTSGKRTLSGKALIQVLHGSNGSGARRPLVYTYSSEDGKQWKKIVRPLSDLLVYGTSADEKALAARLQIDGFRITAIPSSNGSSAPDDTDAFVNANVFEKSTLDVIIDRPDAPFDAVVTAHYEAITAEQDQLIKDKIGMLRAPFMPNHTRDEHLEKIISQVQATMSAPTMVEDDRPLSQVQEKHGDIASGHRLCAGCPVGTAFNLVAKAIHEMDPEIENVHAGATSCAEVATTIYPDTAWPSYLHTTFGGLGANLEGMDSAYRYLRKRGMTKKKLKFWGWAGDGGTYDIGLQALSGLLERGLAKDSVYVCYDNGAYMNTGIQRSSATPLGASTSTSPIGEEIPGKPQFRKDLEHIAGAHNDVYVAKVSPSHQIDFVNKVKKACTFDGPALLIVYSNCTTGHRTATELTTEQSRLAVECGFWPLMEIERGETRISEPYPSAFDPRVKPENKVTLLQWLKSEGRFAQHFDKKGNFVSREHEMQYRELERQLLIAWRKLQAEDRITRKKDKLMGELTEYLKEENAKRLTDVTTKPHLFGLGNYTQDYLDELSWIDQSGQPKPFLKRVLDNVRRCLDPEEYKVKDPELREKLYKLFVREYRMLIDDHRALKREKAIEARAAAESKKLVESVAAGPEMDEGKKKLNRAIVGPDPLAGRIFARAGDGGVTAAKVFVSLLKEVGLFGKAAPDYGPERRGAPVGTNFTVSGKELRTQASFSDLTFSLVVNADDPGWPIAQWRNTVVKNGVLILNTTMPADQARKMYQVPGSVTVVTLDSSGMRKKYRVPETVTLLAGVLKGLVGRGLAFDREYLEAKWQKLLTKEFADKANAEKIVKSNMDAFWSTYDDAQVSLADGAQAVDASAVKTDGFDKSPPNQLLTGSEAIAEAWRQINPGVFAMFPITPSTEVGQTFSQFWADGEVDTEFVHTESEHTSFVSIIAAAASGVRAVTSTASQGMLLGKEGGSLAASLRLPVIVNVGARETNAPLNIHAGHTDFLQFRDDGWLHFMPRNAQEAYDFAIIAQKAAEKASLPAFLNQDGFIVTHNKDMLDLLSDEEVQAFVGEYDPDYSLLKTGGTYNPVALQDYYSEHVRTLSEAQKAVPAIVDGVFEEFGKLTGRYYNRINNYRTDDATVVVVAMGSTEGTALDAVDQLRDQGMKVGLLALKTFRPFPAKELREALSPINTVIVMDRANCHGWELTPLAIEVQAALSKPVLALEYGRGGRNTPLDLVKDVYRLGFLLDSKVKSSDVEAVLSDDNVELKALIRDLELLEGKGYVEGFLRHLAAGELIKAFGPKEHIDVRETMRRREIKRRIIDMVVASKKLEGVGNIERPVSSH